MLAPTLTWLALGQNDASPFGDAREQVASRPPPERKIVGLPFSGKESVLTQLRRLAHALSDGE